MGSFPQSKGDKGSQKWIQILINDKSELLEEEIRNAFEISKGIDFHWKSPLKKKRYEEYRDAAFLRALKIQSLREPLSSFWPARGPQWDALGILGDETAILIEAKAHVSEVLSRMQAKSTKSISLIEEAFVRTKKDLGIRNDNPWTSPFYQYANRIAHLHYLRNINQKKVYLVFVNFVGDEEVGGPKDASEWAGVTELIHSYLGIGRSNLLPFIADLCIDVSELS